MIFDSENILPDDYPTYNGYFYLVNGEPFKNLLGYRNVAEIKSDLIKSGVCENPEIRSCDINKRNLWDLAE